MSSVASTPRFVLLSSDLRYACHRDLHPGGVPAERAQSLTRALARSPIWDRMGSGVLILRTEPVPSLAALGRFDEADVARLTFLARWLPTAVAATRYLDNQAAVAAVATLAGRMTSVFGDEVRAFDYTAIPRGGLIVLGMLAYALDLDAERLEAPRDPERPLVIVDDCALTGSRFRRFTGNDRGSRRIFAHLCSPPELRSAMVDRMPQLTHAIAAVDLRDLARAEHSERYGEWRARVDALTGADRFWVGQPESVVFPWSEPDHNFWNEVTNELEWGWRLAPPELCLKQGAASYPRGVPVQLSGNGSPGLRLADHILYGRFGGGVHLLDRKTGGTLRIDGVGSVVWDGLLAGLSTERIAERVVSVFDVDVNRASEDVRSLTRDLLARGVLLTP